VGSHVMAQTRDSIMLRHLRFWANRAQNCTPRMAHHSTRTNTRIMRRPATTVKSRAHPLEAQSWEGQVFPAFLRDRELPTHKAVVSRGAGRLCHCHRWMLSG